MRTGRARVTDDRGIAMAGVLFIGFALTMIATVVISRGVRQLGNTAADVDWEQAAFVAEAGLAHGLQEVQDDTDFTTGDVMPTGYLGTSDEKSWAVTVADDRTDVDVHETPEGEYVYVKPLNTEAVYGVGFVPSRDAPDRRVRVVRASVDVTPGIVPVTLTHSFLTDGDLIISGNPTSHGGGAGMHANGFVDMPGNPTYHDSCLGASNGADLSGNLNMHAQCPEPIGTQDEQPVPEVNPRDVWYMSEYDMCPDGKVRAGPGHATLGGTVANVPCTGQTLIADASVGYRGWKFNGCCDVKKWAKWDYTTNTRYDGVYYFYQGSVSVPTGPGTLSNPWRVTLIAEAIGTCDNLQGGDVDFGGAAVLTPYRLTDVHANNTAIVIAGRDVEWSGNGRLKETAMVAAHEQIKINGNPLIEIAGSFLAQDACDSINDDIHDNEISGNPVFNLDDELETVWTTGTGPPIVDISGWDEL